MIRSVADKAQLPAEVGELISIDAPILRSDALALWRRVIDVKLTLRECLWKRQLSELEDEYCKLAFRWIEVVDKKMPPEAFLPYPPPSSTDEELVKKVEKLEMLETHSELCATAVEVGERMTRIMGDVSNALAQKQDRASLTASLTVATLAAIGAVAAAVVGVINLFS